MPRPFDRHQWGSSAQDSTGLFQILSRLSAASVLGAKLSSATRNRTSVKGQGHRHPTSRRSASSVSSSRLTLAPLPGLTIIPLGSIKDGLLRRDPCASLQTGNQLSTIQSQRRSGNWLRRNQYKLSSCARWTFYYRQEWVTVSIG